MWPIMEGETRPGKGVFGLQQRSSVPAQPRPSCTDVDGWISIPFDGFSQLVELFLKSVPGLHFCDCGLEFIMAAIKACPNQRGLKECSHQVI